MLGYLIHTVRSAPRVELVSLGDSRNTRLRAHLCFWMDVEKLLLPAFMYKLHKFLHTFMCARAQLMAPGAAQWRAAAALPFPPRGVPRALRRGSSIFAS